METLSNVLFVVVATLAMMQFVITAVVHGMASGQKLPKASVPLWPTWLGGAIAVAAVVIR